MALVIESQESGSFPAADRPDDQHRTGHVAHNPGGRTAEGCERLSRPFDEVVDANPSRSAFHWVALRLEHELRRDLPALPAEQVFTHLILDAQET